MRDFVAPGWQAIFDSNGLGGFEALWRLEADWFEPPNHRRGGWSGVARVVLTLPDGGERHLFLKRQENHTRKTWRRPLRGEPTFRAEARNLRLLNRKGIAAPELVYYAERLTPRGWQVILATLELEGYQPMDRLIGAWWQAGWSEYRSLRRALISEVAGLLRRFHALRQAHNALHAKHIFIDPERRAACLIDLEKMRPRLTRRQAMLRDLDTLNRRTRHLSRTDRLRFLLEYMEKPAADRELRKTWKRLARMEDRKRKGGKVPHGHR